MINFIKIALERSIGPSTEITRTTLPLEVTNTTLATSYTLMWMLSNSNAILFSNAGLPYFIALRKSKLPAFAAVTVLLKRWAFFAFEHLEQDALSDDKWTMDYFSMKHVEAIATCVGRWIQQQWRDQPLYTHTVSENGRTVFCTGTRLYKIQRRRRVFGRNRASSKRRFGVCSIIRC